MLTSAPVYVHMQCYQTMHAWGLYGVASVVFICEGGLILESNMHTCTLCRTVKDVWYCQHTITHIIVCSVHAQASVDALK